MKILPTYKPTMEREMGDKCPKCGSRSALLTKMLSSYCQKCGNVWL